jgi:hypothetical protein
VAGSGQGIEGEHWCEVDERAGDRGDRDAAVGGALGVARSLRDHAMDPPLAHRRHFGRRRGALDQAPQMRGRATAQHRAFAAGPDSREVAGFDARRAVPDAIDATVFPQQRTEGEPVIDLVPRDPRREQLHARHDPVRARRQLRERRFYRADFSGHWPY